MDELVETYSDEVIRETFIDKAHRLQNRAERGTSGVYSWSFSGFDSVYQLEWQAIRERRGYFMRFVMYKCSKGQGPTFG